MAEAPEQAPVNNQLPDEKPIVDRPQAKNDPNAETGSKRTDRKEAPQQYGTDEPVVGREPLPNKRPVVNNPLPDENPIVDRPQKPNHDDLPLPDL